MQELLATPEPQGVRGAPVRKQADRQGHPGRVGLPAERGPGPDRQDQGRVQQRQRQQAQEEHGQGNHEHRNY